MICLSFPALSQNRPVVNKNLPKKTVTSVERIEVLQANTAIYDTAYKDAHRLIGNVVFKHEDVLMFCDSAHFFETDNRVKAYGHIHIQQSDSLNVYSDSLEYLGKKRLAKLRGHVKMIEKDLVMVCDSVDFDAKKSIGWYKGGATITSAKNSNKLTSRSGYYYSSTKDLYFKGDVRLTNPESELTTDTLRYNSNSEIAYFIADTKIKNKDTSEIHTSSGWYDTRKEKSALFKRSILFKKEKTITADSIFYDQKKGIGNLYGKAWMYDTIQKTGVLGNHAYYDEKSEYMRITRKPYLMKAMEKDTLYLTADTIISSRDTSEMATIKAYHRVKFMKAAMFGKADSLIYQDIDSLLRFYTEPVLWSDESQLSGDYMQALLIERKIQTITITANSFIISKADTVGFNQIKGRNIHAYFKDEELSKIKVEGNGQTLYYIGEDGKKISAVNRADCSDILIYVDEKGEIDKITFIYQPEATAYPLEKYPKNEKYLKDFKWLEDEKPVIADFGPILEYILALKKAR